MDYVDLDEELNATEDWGQAALIVEMLEAFPDLKLFRDCWGQLKFCSREANDQVTTMEIDSCHQCDGKPIKMWCYVQIDPAGTRLYSDPPVFIVADQNQNGFGERPRRGWEAELVTAGISPSVIYKVKRHLLGHPPIDYMEADCEQRPGDQGAGQKNVSLDDLAK